MKLKTLISFVIVTILITTKINARGSSNSIRSHFNLEKDLLLVHFDCKTDVDDLQTVAALATLLSNSEFSKMQYHAVAGTYGTQEGLYVPPNDLFQLSFGNNWTDAHKNFKDAIETVKSITLNTLKTQGDIWIAEAGQSNFTAALIKAIKLDLPEINVSTRIHVIQHSNWNEKHTSKESLQFVKENADYQKIPDGNILGNGTPGFSDPQNAYWTDEITNTKLIEIWQLATHLSNKYNGKEGRYDNKAISSGGIDFSDFSEICWILRIQNINDAQQFFKAYSD